MAEEQLSKDVESISFMDVNPENPTTVVESMCMNCHENGTTTFLLTKIPHFREIIISSFECQHCNFKNNSVQFGGAIQPKGVRFTLKVVEKKDADRQVVKGDDATITIPELELEIPPQSQKGLLNTVEGVLKQTAEALGELQEERRKQNPEQADAIDAFIQKLVDYSEVKFPFTMIVDDMSGNSFVENYLAPAADPQLKVEHYERSEYQNGILGINPEIHAKLNATASSIRPKDLQFTIDKALKPEDFKEVIVFPSHCSACHAPGDERMVKIDIPYFKEVVVMSFTCDECGYKNNEVKAGGAVSPVGRRVVLLVKTKEDLSRDVLKSETAGLYVPEIDLEVVAGSLGGRFSTIEGLLTLVRDELKNNAFMSGDSVGPRSKDHWTAFLAQMQSCLNLEKEFHFCLDDPLANSYIQSLTAPEPDPQLVEEEYKRTEEQDQDLGLDQILTEGYETLEEHANGVKSSAAN